MRLFKPLGSWAWAAREDIVSDDSYPATAASLAPLDAAMAGDLMRSLGGGKPWLLMEQTPSQVNWRAQNVLKRPGQMRLWSLQAVARGRRRLSWTFCWRGSAARPACTRLLRRRP